MKYERSTKKRAPHDLEEGWHYVPCDKLYTCRWREDVSKSVSTFNGHDFVDNHCSRMRRRRSSSLAAWVHAHITTTIRIATSHHPQFDIGTVVTREKLIVHAVVST